MKVKLRSILAGPIYNGSPGDILTVDAETGAALIAGGYAAAVEPDLAAVKSTRAAERETATRKPEETAAAAGAKSAAPAKGSR